MENIVFIVLILVIYGFRTFSIEIGGWLKIKAKK